MFSALSETLGPQQRHEQVGREAREGQPEQDEVEAHGSAPLAGGEVEGQQRETRGHQRQHQEVRHTISAAKITDGLRDRCVA